MLQQAESSRKNNDFDAERKFLQESKELRLTAIEDPLQLQRTFADYNERIKRSFEDQLTVIGKKKQEEQSIFDNTIKGIEAQIDTNKILKEQVEIQKTLKQVEEDKIKIRNENIDVLKANLIEFQTAIKDLNSIKIDAKTTPEEAAKQFEDRAKKLDEALKNVANAPGDIVAAEETKARIKDQLARQSAAAELALATATNKKLLEDTQRTEVLKSQIRIKLLQAVLTERDRTAEDAAELRGRIGTNLQKVGDVATVLELELKLKNDRKLVRAIQDSLADGANGLTPELEEQLIPFFEKLSVAGLTDEIRASLDFTDIFANDGEEVDKLRKKLKEATEEIEKPKSFNLVITDAENGLDVLLAKKRELEKPVNLQLQNEEGDPVAREKWALAGPVRGIAAGGSAGSRYRVQQRCKLALQRATWRHSRLGECHVFHRPGQWGHRWRWHRGFL